MIELVSSERCIQCNLCVKVCPMNVFEANEGETPTVVRKEECQTCFICEAYCPVNALYVAPQAETDVKVDEKELIRADLLGSWREEIGWGTNKETMAQRDTTPFIEIFQSRGLL